MSTSTAQLLRRSFLLVAISILTFVASIQGRDALAQGGSSPVQVQIAGDAAPPSIPTSGAAAAPSADLPEAPRPANDTSSALQPDSSSLAENGEFTDPSSDPIAFGVSKNQLPGRVPLDQCPYDKTHAKECRPHWHQLIISSSVFNAFQNAGNLYTSYWYRYETEQGNWFEDWADSVLGWRWGQWHDGNPFLDDWVGHPIMGGITNSLWIQNDPRGMTVELGDHGYWHSRLVAMVYSTAYSFEWKFGPFGEAGFGHNGDHATDTVNGVVQNDTGDVELVSTPVGGLGWTLAEDFLDKHVVRKFEQEPRGTPALLLISFLTPSRATANILRWRAPWYRDSRQVKSTSFFSDPPGPDDVVTGAQLDSSGERPAGATAVGSTSNAASIARVARTVQVLPLWPHYGGVHEFGAWWGLSMTSGSVWGTASNIRYMPIDITYSYLLNPEGKVSLRYSPEMNVLAMLDEPVSGRTDPQEMRKRIYGSGFSPLGLRASFCPENRVQPFLSTNEGAIYFIDSVLAPSGSHYMATVDFGGGLTIYRKQRQSVSIGYRYQHLFNADIGSNTPTTDANTFFVAVSRFRTRGYR
ncbi:MAG: acyloxyacyl hydrolase [Terracidiphilus sp.]|jgi:hypothetical protein